MDYTYIMSGISMVLKQGSVNKIDNNAYASMVSETIRKGNYRGERPFLGFETMFNAYQEDKLMTGYLTNYDRFGSTWHSDSGGLQMVTQNKTITEELKDKIYDIQANHSSYAMCFDEMPIRIVGTNKGMTSRLDLSNRQYIVEWAKDKAILTGKNVKRQIEIIRKNNSDTKVFIICQGNETKDFLKYYNNVMAQLPEDYYTSIAGVALSAACTGLGILETIKMLGSYRYMHIPKGMGNKLHLLGFGSVSRLYPMMLLKASGYLEADITFDSSSHAMGCLLGEITVKDSDVLKDGKYAFGIENIRSKRVDNIYRHIYSRYKEVMLKQFPDLTEDAYLAIVGYDHTTSKRYHKRRTPRHLIKKYNITVAQSICIQLYTRFLVSYDSYTAFSKRMAAQHKSVVTLKDGNEEGLISDGCKTFATGDKAQTAINGLLNIKTTEDFEDHLPLLKKSGVKSNHIERFSTLAEASVPLKVPLDVLATTEVEVVYIKVKTKTKHEPAVTF